jgi:RHS repeat-associated protein
MKNIITIISVILSIPFVFGQVNFKESAMVQSTTLNPVIVPSSGYSVTADNISTPNNSTDRIHKNLIKVNARFEERLQNPITALTNVSLSVRIKPVDFNNNILAPYDKVISLTYDPISGANPHDREQSIEIIDVSHTVKGFTFSILSAQVNGVTVNSLPNYLQLYGQLITERYVTMDPTLSPLLFNSTTPYLPDYLVDQDCDFKSDGLNIIWSNVPNALEYQLEYAFVNDYALINSTADKDPSMLLFDFKRNSTRISTQSNSHLLNLVFDKGWVVFRIRAIGVDAIDPTKRIYGEWSVLSETGNVNQIPVNSKIKIDLNLIHEKELNWQYSATFAEEGKLKEIGSYFDVSLRTRQMVTKLNSTDQTIVGETIYDFEGRPAIQTLPTPAFCNSNLSGAIRFFPDFNKSANDPSRAYDYTDFDFDVSCVNGTTGMSNTSGSSQYYSVNNPNKQGYQGYVPEANNFPFTQTQYTSDNTGRIRQQSGVGETFNMNEDHTTKYLYGKPNQVELDRLFGSEVGYSSHYQKNAVIDPNGQVSISYLIQEGKVIATALAGDSPDNFETLASGQGNATPLTINPFIGNLSSNRITTNSDGYEMNEKIILTGPTVFSANYALDVTSFVNECIPNICFNCHYDLSIQLLDECGENKLLITSTGANDGSELINELVGSLTMDINGNIHFELLNCSNPSQYDLNYILETEVIPAGEYHLVKKIKINQDSRESYLETVLNPDLNDCILTLEDFESQEIENIDSTLCHVSCQECFDALGTLADYIAAGKGTEFDYNENFMFCEQNCGEEDKEVDLSSGLVVLMEKDMSPGGQYGEIRDDQGNFNPSLYVLSVYNANNKLPKINGFSQIGVPGGTRNQWRFPRFLQTDGTYRNLYFDDQGQTSRITVVTINGSYVPQVDAQAVIKTDPNTGELYIYPHELANVQDFYDTYWQPSWAKSLIFYHPEYSYYLSYQPFKNKFGGTTNPANAYSSNSFDNLLVKTNTFQEAVNAGLINVNFATAPTHLVVADWFTQSSNDTRPFDPFGAGKYNLSAANGHNFISYSQELKNKFDHFYLMDGQWLSMVEFAAYTARCGAPNSQVLSSCFNFGKGANASILNDEWSKLKSFYLSAKEEIKLKRAREISTYGHPAYGNRLGYNDCIEEESYSPLNPISIFPSNGSGFASFFFAPFIATEQCQPCGQLTYSLYKDKDVRFPDPEEMKDIDPTDSYYHHYKKTGQCPEMLGVENVFKELLSNNQFFTPNVNIQNSPSLAFLFQYANGMQFYGSPPNLVHNCVITQGYNMDITWTEVGTNQVYLNLNMQLDGNSGFNWNQLSEIMLLRVLNNNILQGKVKLNTPTGQVNADVIGGNFGSLFTLSGCTFPNDLHTNQFAQDINGVLNVLSNTNNLYASNPILIDPIVAFGNTITLPQSIAFILNPNAVGQVYYQKLGNEFSFYHSSNANRKIIIRYFNNSDLAPIPTGISAFSNIVTTGDNNFTQKINIGGTIYTMYGEIILNDNGVISDLETGYQSQPVPIRCQDDAVQNFADFKKILEDLLLDLKIEASNDPKITESPYFFNSVLADMTNGDNTIVTNSSNLIQPNFFDAGGSTATCSMTFHLNNCQTKISTKRLGQENYFEFNRISSIENYVFDPLDMNTDGTFNKFYVDVKVRYYDDLLPIAFYRLTVETCVSVKPCDGCDDNAEGTYQQLSNIPRGEVILSTEEYLNQYETYRNYLTSINDENGLVQTDPLFLQAVTYEQFVISGGHISIQYANDFFTYAIPEFILENFEKPGEFGIDLSEQLGGNATYERYVETIGRHNGRVSAAIASNGTVSAQAYLDTMNFSTFMTLHYVDSANKYNHYLWNLSDSLLDNVSSIQVYTTTPSFPSNIETQYSSYVTKSLDFIANGGADCRKDDLFSLTSLIERNTFCNAKAHQNFGIYLDQLDNYESCPTFLDYYTSCDSNSAIDYSTRIMSEMIKLREVVTDQAGVNQLFSDVNSDSLVKIISNVEMASIQDELIPFETPSYATVSLIRVNPCDQVEPRPTTSSVLSTITAVALPIIGQPLDNYPIKDLAPKEFSKYVETVSKTLDTVSVVNQGLRLLPVQQMSTVLDYPCDTLYPEPVNWCSEAENQFMSCLNDITDWSLANYPSEGPFDGYSDRYIRLGGNYQGSICYCVDEFCNRTYDIINGSKSVTNFQEIIDYIFPSYYCNPESEFCDYDIEAEYDFKEYEVEPFDPCYDFLYEQALISAKAQYENYMDSVYAYYVETYNENCMQFNESMNYTYDDKQYHYTLYYYDQAGNLTKTVPPAGVLELPITSFSDPLSEQIEADRHQNAKTVLTQHQLQTRYEYNSLNQLIYQYTPDTDPIDVFDVNQSNGLPYKFETIKVDMVTETEGYLIGTFHGEGQVYYTVNAGHNWQLYKNWVASNLKDVIYISDSEGYAIGQGGIILKTTNGGRSWVVLNTFTSSDMIVNWKKIESFNVSGITYFGLASETGGYVQTTDFVNFTAINLPTTGLLTGGAIAINDLKWNSQDNRLYILANYITNGETYSMLFNKTATALTWTNSSIFSSRDYTNTQVVNNKLYVVGSNGQMFKGQLDLLLPSTEVYNKVPTHETGNIQQLALVDEQKGYALIENGGQRKLHKTTNSGLNWTLVDSDNYTSIYPSKGGQVSIGAELGGGLSLIPFGQGVYNKADYLNFPLAGQIDGLWVEGSATTNANFAVAASVLQKIVCTMNGNVASPVWQVYDLSPTLGTQKIVKIEGEKTGTSLHLFVHTDQFKLYRLFLANTNGVLSHTISLLNNGTLYQDFGIDEASNALFATTKNTPYKLGKASYSTVGGGSVGSLVVPLITSYSESYHLKVINNSNVLLFSKGSSGSMIRINLLSSSDKTKSILPGKLNTIAVHPTQNQVAVIGESGTIFAKENTLANDLKRLNSSVKEDILCSDWGKHIVIGGTHQFMGVLDINITGNSSTIHQESDFLQSKSSQSNESITDVALANISATENQIGFVTNTGNFVSGELIEGTTPYFSLNNYSTNEEGYFGIVHKASTKSFEAVGDYAHIREYFGSFVKKKEDIRTSGILDVDFLTNSSGVILAQGGFARRKNNSNQRWEIILPNNLVGNLVLNNPFNKGIVVNNSEIFLIGNSNRRISNNQMSTTNFSQLQGVSGIRRSDESVVIGTSVAGIGGIYVATLTNNAVQTNAVSPSTPVSGIIQDFALFDNDSYMYVTNTNQYGYLWSTHSTRFVNTYTNGSLPAGFSFRSIDFTDRTYGVIVGTEGTLLKTETLTSTVDAEGYLLNDLSLITKSDVYTQPGGNTSINQATNIDYLTVHFTSNKEIFIGGKYDVNYTPSLSAPSVNYYCIAPNNRYSSQFFYDRLGRLVVSQNARQYAATPKKYSYTLYDELGRVVEVGEKTENNGTTFDAVYGTKVNGVYNANTIDQDLLESWIAQNGPRKEVTKTFYDEVVLTGIPNYNVDPLTMRKRIAHVAYYEVYTNNDQNFEHATHYNYDIHGNVKMLLQDNRKMSIDNPSSLASQRFKRMDYVYDLISGNVKIMSYQFGGDDQWTHAYTYDSDNRVTSSYTNSHDLIGYLETVDYNLNQSVLNDVNWEKDAEYFYYDHGPLARIELGDKKVQGMDYVYTIQGWLKGVNSTLLSNTTDPGKDGNGSIFPVDVMGYNLHYYEGDYAAIESNSNQSANRFYGSYSNSEITSNSSNLYNGNIRSMQTTLRDINSYTPMYMATAYTYDQLNRLTGAVAYQGNDFDEAQNKWIPITTTNQYKNNFTFDANGNILHQTRYNSAGDVIDDMDYNYQYSANGRLIRNRLYHLTETVSSSAFTDDIDPMGAFVPHSANADINASNNYVYDQEGRLVRDKAENLTIEWRVDGKVKRIIDEDGGQPNGPEHKYIEFDYDAMGNRIAKHTYSPTEELIKSTYYLLDAQGNLISTYEHKLQQSTVSYKQVERYMYGSSRLGVFGEETDMLSSLAPPDDEIIYNKVGYKSYEMSNHLGNVLTVVNDVVNGDANSGYVADIASIADYSPFGVQLDGRTQNSGSYRFTFQGQESDDEVKGSGNSVNFKYRMHDPRVGRFFAVDPLISKYPHYSSYGFSGNRVINCIELEGAEELVVSTSPISWTPVLYTYTESSLQNQIMFVTPGTGSTDNTVTRPVTLQERTQFRNKLNRVGPFPLGRPGTSTFRPADTQSASNFLDGNGQAVRQNLDLQNRGTELNPVTSPPNTTVTNISGDFGATAAGANQVFNFQIANGATTITMSYTSFATFNNTFTLTDPRTGAILTPTAGGTGTVAGSGTVILNVPAGCTNLQLTVTSAGGNIQDQFDANITSSSTAPATNVAAVNNTVSTPVTGGTSEVTQTTSPIIVNTVPVSSSTPINN